MVAEHYEANTQYYVDKAKARRVEIQAMIREAKNRPCTDCKIPYPSWVMTFDHLPGKKKRFELSSMKALCASKQAVLDEIAKCEVVCFNCHAERTHSRQCPRSLVERHQPPELGHVGSSPAEGTEGEDYSVVLGPHGLQVPSVPAVVPEHEERVRLDSSGSPG